MAEPFDALERHGIEYVVIRGAWLLDTRGPGELRVLVRGEQLGRAEEISRGAELPHLRIVATDTLTYGRGLRTGAHEGRVLQRRRRNQSGVAIASASDELVDLVLHCVLDEGSFSPPHRHRVGELIAELRADPPAAGRAAERFQQELAPALPWAELLADVLHGRWDDVLARRARIARHLDRRNPLSALRRLAAPGSNGRHVPSNGAHAVAEPGARPPAAPPNAASVTRKQIRGSGLMLAGRGLSGVLKFASELIVVRYLATSDYGAWTYALAAVTFLRGMSALGLHRAIARYLPLHLERRELDKFYGVLVVTLSLTALAATAVIAVFFAFPRFVSSLAGVTAEQPLDLLFVMIFLLPLESFDNALQGVCAALGLSRPIFFRRFVLYPGLRLLIAIVLVALAADVTMLAWGYLTAGVIGVGYYAWTLLARLRDQGLLRGRRMGASLPFGTVLGFSMPAAAADAGAVFMTTAGPLLLGYFTDMSTVALYQVVIPVAALNHMVAQAFVMLFEPSASRLVARGDRAGLDRHYWRTAMWVAVLSFPLFALSFTAAVPLTELLFGERYAAAAPILSLLALSQFVEATAGFNAETLRVNGKMRWLIAANVMGVAVLVGISLALIPSMGALGAGIGTAAGQLCYTVLKQIFVRIAVGVQPVDHEHGGFYGAMIAMCAVLVGVRIAAPTNLWIIAPVVLAAVLVVFVSARRSLSISETFPELGRIPLLTRILG